MEKIASFTIDHIKLQPGLYVSRKDKIGAETITTFDLRLTKPNDEPVMNTAEIHTMEHLAATFLRNEPSWKDRVIYFGPMGCRTGFYLLTRDVEPSLAVEQILAVLDKIAYHSDKMFGAERKECGNYRELSLQAAQREAARYLSILRGKEIDLKYPTEEGI